MYNILLLYSTLFYNLLTNERTIIKKQKKDDWNYFMLLNHNIIYIVSCSQKIKNVIFLYFNYYNLVPTYI